MLKIVPNQQIKPIIWDKLTAVSSTATFFQTSNWLNLWLKHFPKKSLNLVVYNDNLLIGLASFSINKEIQFLGLENVLNQQLVTDYGDFILVKDQEKIVLEQILNYLRANFSSQTLILNFVRENSLTYSLLSSLNFAKQEIDISPQIKLTNNWEKYLQQLNGKNRHELKRKITRFEKAGANIIWIKETNDSVINDFLDLMAASAKAKNQFLSEKMKNYFKDIFKTFSNEIVLGFATLDDRKIASVLAFKYKNSLLLYNSGFDPQFGRLSPGLILKSFLIKWAIEQKYEIFDFLRGGERYKFELGAVGVKLYQFSLKL